MTSTPRPACYTASFLLRPPEPDEFLIIFLPSQEIGELGGEYPTGQLFQGDNGGQ